MRTDRVTILGIEVNSITRTEALVTVSDFLSSQTQHTVFTPNPEIIVKAQQDEYFRQVLNSSSLSVCDGFGLWVAANIKIKKTKCKNVIERVTGVDLMLDVCKIAAEQGKKVYLLGSGSDFVVKKVVEKLEADFSKLRISGFNKGIKIDELRIKNQLTISNSTMKQRDDEIILSLNAQENDRLLENINQAKPDVLFVAFGMGKQEKWIHENLEKMPSVKLAMGVGGAFDYISGNIPRAPLLLRKIGLEWLYRLVRQPRRIKRIFNATVRFIYLCFMVRFN